MEETLKILLVDRDAAARLAVQQTLNEAAIEADISEAETCTSAIARLQQEPLDCVLLEYRLPDGDGLQLVNRAKHLGITVPLIVLTEQSDEQIVVSLMKAGAVDCLFKRKLAPGTLARSIFNAVRMHRAQLQAAEATRQLHESEERYRLVLEGSYDGIWDWYICKNEVVCNDRLLEIVGIAREAMSTAQEAFYQLIHPDDQPHVLDAITAHLREETPFDVEFRLRHASGSYRYCISQGRAQRDEHNMPFRMSGIVSDITPRKQAEAEIVKLNRALERRVVELQSLFDVIPIGIAIADDADCQTIRINPTYAEMLGIAPETHTSFTQQPNEQLPYRLLRQGQSLPPQAFPMQAVAALGHAVLENEFDILRSDGTLINVIGHATPLFDEQNKPRGCVGAFLDITSLKQAEATQRFLAEAGSVLATSLDYQTILNSISQLAVPALGDCCFFDILNKQQFQFLPGGMLIPQNKDWFIAPNSTPLRWIRSVIRWCSA